MKILTFYISLFTLLMTLVACQESELPQNLNIIPLPEKIDIKKGQGFKLSEKTSIFINEIDSEALNFSAASLAEFMTLSTGIPPQIKIGKEAADFSILLSLKNDFSQENKHDVSYSIKVTTHEIKLVAANSQGLFYGVQSLKQLIFNSKDNNVIPLLKIEDQPRFEYRGVMLDVSRHFFSVQDIKNLLDMMALYKMNKFHWHLSDDQGWRIEIDKYPLLTLIGSYRQETILEKNFDPFIGDNQPYSGFYRKDEIKEVVEYAKQRYITIIPEIDLPGHMQAALAAYPELACTQGPFDVSTRWGVHPDILCPSEFTFTFLEDVLTEVMDLFPGGQIHLGGDEVPTWRWQQSEETQLFMSEHQLKNESDLHGYFFQRMSNFLAKNNRKAIGWDDLLGKGAIEPTTIMVWQQLEQATIAIKNQHKVIMSPSEFTYFNYYQGDQKSEPLAQCCFLPIKKVYQFEPLVVNLSAGEQKMIIGLQANLWTEYIKTAEHLEYMLLPRLMALSEVAWTNKELKSWPLFEQRYLTHFALLNALSINYRNPN